jgi:flagellar biosynthesis regulator FlaF
VEGVLALQDAWLTHKEIVDTMEAALEENMDSENEDFTESMMLLNEARAKASRIRKAFQTKRATLGVDGRLNLQLLTNDNFLRLRMNARALKKRIRDRLRQRKFELERLERAYRHTSNGKYKC